MKERLFSLAALAAVSSLPARGDVSAESREFQWRHDLEPARREAIASGKPLLVVFR